MPYHQERRDGILIVTMHGVLTMEDLNSIIEIARIIDAEKPVPPHRLCDLTAVTGINLDFQKMFRFASERRISPLKHSVKSAIVAAQPVHYGFARMFQTLNDHPKIQIKIFPDQPSALLWLFKDK